jgi:hypothetical protein
MDSKSSDQSKPTELPNVINFHGEQIIKHIKVSDNAASIKSTDHVALSIGDPNVAEEMNDVSSTESLVVRSDRLKRYIIKEIVQPAYVLDIKDTLEWRFKWRRISRIFFWMTNVILLACSVLYWCFGNCKCYCCYVVTI